MTFPGFHPDAFAFYAELAEHNEREWWLAHKRRYDEHVRAPVAALAEELGGEFGPIKVFRPYRDVRFAADKRPYKEQVALVTQGGTGTHYLHLDRDGVLVAGGYHRPASDQLGRFRAIVDDIRLVGDLEATLEEIGERGLVLRDAGALATAPRGYSTSHPRIGLLRLRDLVVSLRWDPEPWLLEETAAERVRAVWRTISIWNDWLAENVGPTTAPSAIRR